MNINDHLTLNDFIENHSALVATMTANELAERFSKSLGCVYQCLKKHGVECRRQRARANQDSPKLPLRAALWAMKYWDKDDPDRIETNDFIDAFDHPSLCAMLEKLGSEEIKALRAFAGQPLTQKMALQEKAIESEKTRIAEIQKTIKRYLDQDSDLLATQARARAIALGTSIALYNDQFPIS